MWADEVAAQLRDEIKKLAALQNRSEKKK